MLGQALFSDTIEREDLLFLIGQTEDGIRSTKAYAIKQRDLDLLSDLRVYETSSQTHDLFESEFIARNDSGIGVGLVALRQAYEQSNFQIRIKMLRRARRDIEDDEFFGLMLDEMVAVQEHME